MATQVSLHTKVSNPTDASKTYGFPYLDGVRAVTLAPDEVYYIPGNLVDQAARNPLTFNDLQRWLENGDLHIISTPGVILYDATLSRSRQLGLNNNSLGLYIPSWHDSA